MKKEAYKSNKNEERFEGLSLPFKYHTRHHHAGQRTLRTSLNPPAHPSFVAGERLGMATEKGASNGIVSGIC